jgi:hypothetical protein
MPPNPTPSPCLSLPLPIPHDSLYLPAPRFYFRVSRIKARPGIPSPGPVLAIVLSVCDKREEGGASVRREGGRRGGREGGRSRLWKENGEKRIKRNRSAVAK